MHIQVYRKYLLHRNFHVWNEVWLTRPDIPKGFGGWQILDATPSVKSNGDCVFHLGPAPRHAVKLGQRMNYDVEYVISEVCYKYIHTYIYTHVCIIYIIHYCSAGKTQ